MASGPATRRPARAIAAAARLRAVVAGAGLVLRAETVVSVAFEFADAQVRAHFGTNPQVAEHQVADAVSADLNTDPKLRFWTFQAGTTPPLLRVRMTKV